MNLPETSAVKFVELLLNQRWHRECEIIPYYMPPHPKEDTRPKVVVMFPNKYENTFLRYSCGPAQGFFWDIYGDDMCSVELAVLALSQAPVPLNYRKLESHTKFQLQSKKKDVLQDIAERYINEVGFLDSNHAGIVRAFAAYVQLKKEC